ncbi:zinc-binding dehydrogenase [Amycolatopsis acidiphila]|uniref:Zinc-binding dehydrogenase n=1 Tax=Amycolatopsis acidiphila TaxID=715473 RepID=A0A558A5J1_9PSEU|nr:zinc-binding dehydrogenase [Amycolatopsis acidiphila]TVT19510.1 zinc-binding dehydrogenase [Amycolatopsis acidiphila]UIJ56900.1 zinc-binding dehydrogenase [Amycolatopsis acidiphila]GHG54462.1 NADPH:quinone reductase [Amycolatopsis acidiphila]
MHQIEVAAFGGPEVLRVRHVPGPEPGPGQVAIDVAAAGVLGADLVLRGRRGAAEPPYVPGTGVAGRVSALGESVPAAWLGRRVLAEPVGGGYAERVLAAESGLIAIPDAVHEQEAMALLHDGSTALALLDAAEVRSGESVLVLPAAGALGSLLVQLAHAAGARVVGAARGRTKLELAEALGADVVVDYSEPGWAEKAGYADVVFDGVGGEIGRAAFERAKSRFAGYGCAGGNRADIPPGEGRGVTVLGIDRLSGLAPDRVARILREAALGRVVPLIGQTYPLVRAAEAHAAIESRRAIGKTLLLT